MGTEWIDLPETVVDTPLGRFHVTVSGAAPDAYGNSDACLPRRAAVRSDPFEINRDDRQEVTVHGSTFACVRLDAVQTPDGWSLRPARYPDTAVGARNVRNWSDASMAAQKRIADKVLPALAAHLDERPTLLGLADRASATQTLYLVEQQAAKLETELAVLRRRQAAAQAVIDSARREVFGRLAGAIK